MSRKELLDSARDKLNSGRGKQEVFKELSAEFPYKPREVARLLRFLPTLEMKRKYRYWHITVMASFIFLFAMQAGYYVAGIYGEVSTLNVFLLCLFSFVTISGMNRYSGLFYLNAAILAFLHFIQLFSLENFAGVTLPLIIEMLLSAIVICSGVFLRVVMESRFSEEKSMITDEIGTQTAVYNIVFK